jgi:tRNA-dihydrouridine synthase A
MLADAVIAAGADVLYVHARKAWLQGLSPKENRTVPPLDYDRVYRLAERLAPFPVVVNGGIETLADAQVHLHRTSGVMLGRAAYQEPMLLAEADRTIFGDIRPAPGLPQIIETMAACAERERIKGTRLNQITRHMLGLANGRPGARRFRQILSVDAAKAGAGPEIIWNAYDALEPAAEHPLETA